MKNQLTILDNGRRTSKMTEAVSGRQPVLALLMRLLWAAALALPLFGAQGAVVLTSLHSFQVFPNGANPNGLVQGSDGYLYGTTSDGGTNGGYGTVFQISTNGALTSLYSFAGDDGVAPNAGLVQGSDGDFYGTTSWGGTNGSGIVFKISPNGALTSLYSFTGGEDGRAPSGGLVQGSDGNFYGTTAYGGTNNMGTVFKISPNGALTSLFSFTGTNDDSYPNGLVQGSDGCLYGTTSVGDTDNWGTVFKISTSGALSNLYSFTGGDDGWYPNGLVQGSDGYLYGTTFGGGTNGYGTVFKISPNGALTSLYLFTGTNDGANPYSGLMQGSDGYFYGTTSSGGTKGCGTVFKISPSGALSNLYSFTGGVDGGYPAVALVQGSDGNLYGSASGGGTYGSAVVGWGTVFKISSNGALTSLYSFTGTKDGANPYSGLAQGSDGYLYGTTEMGGMYGVGTVFKISPNGALSNLHSFTGGNDGGYPTVALVQGSDGDFYGSASGGGTNGFGTVFRISSSGALSNLYSFTGGNDGENPLGRLVQGSDGNFYGTTAYGGTNKMGTVFKMSPNGALTSLYSFTGTNDGAYPAGLVQGSDGYLYGTTYEGGTYHRCGNVFKISTNGAVSNLYSFTGGDDGCYPAGLMQGSDGYFYGTTSSGGTDNWGTVFKISTNGALTSLYSFTGTNDGAGPNELVQGSDGYLYGATSSGGDINVNNGHGGGTVFRISTSGTLTSFYSFTGGKDGGEPYGGLVQGSDGSFYGMTAYGGTSNMGTIFRLTIVPEPQLTIIHSSPYVILTWSTNYAGFILQSTTNPGSSVVWSTNSSPPVVIGGQNVVINAISGRQQFFRLSQ
jgi:uncharacterized repeat protein (TIGR03803 family)